jgi:hypothetical protein
VLRKADERRKLDLWDFMQLFFPEDSNKKQFDCAHKFMKHLQENKTVESSSLKAVVGSDYVTLVMLVLPKLEKFGLIRIIGERGRGKTYRIQLDKRFSERLRYVGLEWFRVYARYGAENGES